MSFIVHALAISVQYKGINYNSKNFLMHIHGLVLWNRVLFTTLKSFIVHAPATSVCYKGINNNHLNFIVHAHGLVLWNKGINYSHK